MPGSWRDRPVPWVPLLVTFGLGLRAYHYLINPSMWHDEAALVVNVLDKGFVELLGPLRFSEAAPPLFLWIEKVIELTLGESTFALRLVPFLASGTALLLLVPLARTLLPPAAVPWAVFLFAFSDKLLWHACEAKPYAVDVLAATLLALLYCRTRSWDLTRRLVGFSLLCPLLILLAYPGCFLAGGLLVALLPEAWHSRRGTTWAAYVGLALAVFLAFGLLAAGPVRAQRDATILSAWTGSFPDWSRPWTVPWWSFLATLELHRYCADPAGPLLFFLSVLGAVWMWRRGRREVVALLAVPIGLPWAASCFRAYPYGGARVLVYVAPALFLFTAAGIVLALEWLRPRTRWGLLIAMLVLLSPAARVLEHLVTPDRRADCAGAASYVLDHRHASDRIFANHWEYLYYFRQLGPTLVMPEGPIEFATQDRVWMVITDARDDVRMNIARTRVPPDWQMIHHRHFARTTVFLFQPASSVP